MKLAWGNEDTDTDVGFLKTIQLPVEEYIGSGTAPVFRFTCVPNSPYLTQMPTGNDVIRSMGYETHFQGMQRGLKGTEMPYFPQEKSASMVLLWTDRLLEFSGICRHSSGTYVWFRLSARCRTMNMS